MLCLGNLILAFAFCCRSLAVLVVLSTAVLVMHCLGKLVLQFTAAVAVYLLPWRLLGARFCCSCRLFVVLVMLYRVDLVLLSAAASIYCWLSW
ncbi:hypothetical protein MAM1_0146c06547 [Mucor ambiguus]|uniref:Uncharacterized protein n=1 Tax=Mucor ambiguus TaxID=91626 RepID=A0A0C9MUE2_9FUNG|nr:hypothetical protein MAM1_0146c06547 [Mucor ambiguus]